MTAAAVNDDGHHLPALASSPVQLPSITTSELRSHSSAADLWMAIDGVVYDITRWLPEHPGGQRLLLSLAGQDVSDAFLAFHGAGSAASLIRRRFAVAKLSDHAPSTLSLDYRSTVADLYRSGFFRVEFRHYAALAFGIVSVFAVCVAGILSCDSPFVHMACAVLLGLFWSQTSFVMHDYAHAPFFRNQPVVDGAFKAFVACFLTGLSPSWWKKSHNSHHVCTNNLSHDPDVQFIPLFAISSKFFSSLYSHYHGRLMSFDHVARFLVSYQHWTFYPVMLFARLNLLLQAPAFFSTAGKFQGKTLEICGILSFWLWFSALLACLPNHAERVGFLFVSCGTTAIQHLQFCLNHFACEVTEGMPEGGEFLRNQVRGTLNIECPTWMDWFHGGLQFQLEHHLFPRLPRHKLRRVSAIAKALCAKHGLPYVSVGFWEANRMLFMTLRAAAMEARDWNKPITKNLVWDLVNANG